MKLGHFIKDNERFLGYKSEDGIINVNEAAKQKGLPLPESIDTLIRSGEQGRDQLHHVLEAISDPSLYLVKEQDITFDSVVINPEKILCVGLNYMPHVEEADMAIPDSPVLFSKFNNTLAGHQQEIPLPKTAEKYDYEAELVMIVGKEARDVSEEDALSYIYGYCVGNDVSARDLQMKSGQWLLGKTLDAFAPIGPYLVTSDEVDPTNLSIECKINGEVRQLSNTKNMIFSCATLISYISKYMTLKPGDVIFSGTPEGVILGYTPDKQNWLKAGDEMEVTIGQIGQLKNKLV
ncbi:fumarylacetoacetate hydrolase family protein [Bacillus safensis]|uniref:fumarylacetoacetate hydrolase family protein n=1 Tax=Bacillus safensis TaxID=561879 RepID=UPI000F87E8F0|nr:fumarylacetoacetate hydrolase family protein [Bacillus safensis]MBU5209655.1 fumarylacetoacetate hydrolase family protein [Bacillus safensis]RUK40451.1 FAA hydrolase family protein [Bacillus safensis]WCL57888.1 fumarylacetoacetate hydrolase family protein [Bacillus safensis]